MVNQFEQKMLARGIKDSVIQNFKYYYKTYLKGTSKYISESSIKPIKSLPKLSDLTKYKEIGVKQIKKVAIIQLAGGTGTSMGVTGAKALIKTKDNLTFIDILVKQSFELNKKYKVAIPVVFLTSEATNDEIEKHLDQISLPKQNLPYTFKQNMFPKIDQKNQSSNNLETKSKT